MIIISLDEQGHFERSDIKEPKFIGGLFYECSGPIEEKLERKRIEAYYRRVVADAKKLAKNKEYKYEVKMHDGTIKKYNKVLLDKFAADIKFPNDLHYEPYNEDEMAQIFCKLGLIKRIKDAEGKAKKIKRNQKFDLSGLYDLGLISKADLNNHRLTDEILKLLPTNNGVKVQLTKKIVQETIAEYIKAGTYNGEPLKDKEGNELGYGDGEYHLFAMILSDNGKSSLTNKNLNVFVNDNAASNLYVHMASNVVNRAIFYNPMFDTRKEDVYVDIATRSSASIFDMSDEERITFEMQGVKTMAGGSSQYRITDDSIYKTIIAKEMLDKNITDVRLKKFRVSAMKYDDKAEDMEFLWLSDSLCTSFGWELMNDERDNAEKWLDELIKRINDINPEFKNLVYVYDDVDEYYEKAYVAYEQGDIFNALANIYDGSHIKSKYADYYNEWLFKELENKILNKPNSKGFKESIDKLPNVINSNALNQEKLIYLLENIEIIKDKYIDRFYKATDDKAKALYKLYNSALAGYCHIGDCDKAKEYYDKCLSYSKYIEISDILISRNRYITCLCDNFEFEEANKEALVGLGIATSLSDTRKNLLNEKINGDFLNLTIAKSQLAQTYALMCNNKAVKYFKEALKGMDKNTANYKITQSYLLHYYADVKSEVDFEKEATSYFDGRKDYMERYDYILECARKNNPLFNIKYMTYIYVKGLYTFKKDEFDYDFLLKVTSIYDDLKKINKSIVEGHPWEITYKYLALICLEFNEKIFSKNMSSVLKTIIDVKPVEKGAKDFIKLLSKKLNVKGKTIEAIERYEAIEIFDINGLEDLRNVAIDELVDYLKNNFTVFKDYEFSNDYNKCNKQLSKYFRFMYR